MMFACWDLDWMWVFQAINHMLIIVLQTDGNDGLLLLLFEKKKEGNSFLCRTVIDDNVRLEY